MKRFAAAITLLAAALAPSAAGAITVPEVYVVETTLESAGPFRAGETLSGSFKVKNQGTEMVASLPTSVDLMAGYAEDSAPGELVDSYPLDPIRLEAGETVSVPFSVTLPVAYSGEAVVVANVEIVPGGNRSGAPTAAFQIGGGLPRANVARHWIELSNGTLAQALSGPFIYKPGTGAATSSASSAKIVFEIEVASAVRLTPDIVINEERSGVGAAVAWEGKGETVDVAANTLTNVSVPLPDLGYMGKVYAGELRFLDAEGRDRSGVFHFRYVARAGDDMGRILTFSFGDAKPGTDSVSLVAAVVGSPIDLSILGSSPEPVAGELVFEAIGESGETVASTSVPAVLRATAQDLAATLAVPADETFLRYRLSLVSEGRTLDVEEGTLLGEASDPWYKSPLILPTVIIIVVLALIDALFRFVAKRRGKAAGQTAAATTIAIALIAGATLVPTASIDAATCDDDGPSVWFNYPSPGASVACGTGGAIVPVSVSGIYDACSNSPSNEVLSVWFRGSQIFSAQDDLTSFSSHGQYTLNLARPHWNSGIVQNGTYQLRASMKNAAGCWTKEAVAHTSFTVTGCDVCTNVPGIQSSVGSGWVKDSCGDDPGNCYEVKQPTSCEVENLRTLITDPVNWTAAGCDSTCVWADGSTGTTETIVSSVAGALTTTVKSMKSIAVPARYEWRKNAAGEDVYVKVTEACVNTEYSAPLSCEATIVVEDLCNNLAGVQNPVPSGLTRNAGGACVCPEGSTYDPVDDRCEDPDGVCTTCGGTGTGGGCPVGTKYCNGACIDADAACATTVVASCPLVPPESQYCVEVYNRSGVTYLGFTAAQLEQIFGYALPDAARDQLRGGFTTPIFGAVGRALTDAGSLDAKYGSSGCGGALCAFGSKGCLTTIDPVTNDPVADCVSPNDPVGGGVPPSAILEVEPSVVGTNGHCNVYWGSHEMQTCTVSGNGLTPPKISLAGTFVTPDLTSSATYNLVCTGTDGRTYSDSDTCAVNPDVVEF